MSVPKLSRALLFAVSGLAITACGNAAPPESVVLRNHPPAIYALVIGINHYGGADDLAGAVNDARLMQSLALDLGAQKVITLIDGAATRAGILDGWKSLAAASSPGDLILVTYAGHGAQAKERVVGSEPDGMDEYFKLGGYNADQHEVILDDEWGEMFDGVRDRRVIFVADSCHAGDMFRSASEEKYVLHSRYSPSTAPPLFAEKLAVKPDTLPHVVRVAAAPEKQKMLEISVGGESHGALTVAFDLALRGGADQDKNGTITVGELFDSIRHRVGLLTDGGAQPVLEAPGATSQDLIKTLPYKASPRPSGTVAIDAPDGRKHDLRGITVVEPSQADLVWDQVRRVLIRRAEGSGQIVAVDVQSVDDVRGELLRWEARALLGEIPAATVEMKYKVTPIDENQDCNREGIKCQTADIVRFSWERPATGYVTVINLSSKGVLFDLSGADEAVSCVEPPYGAEHVALLVTEAPLPISTGAGGRGSVEANMDALRKAAASPTTRISMLSLYTEAGPGNCRP